MTDSEEKLGPPGNYILGHSGRELARLSAQARLLGPITRRFLREAGITAGMRVLDVGTGVGDVAFMAAELVGEAGGSYWGRSRAGGPGRREGAG